MRATRARQAPLPLPALPFTTIRVKHALQPAEQRRRFLHLRVRHAKRLQLKAHALDVVLLRPHDRRYKHAQQSRVPRHVVLILILLTLVHTPLDVQRQLLLRQQHHVGHLAHHLHGS